MMTKKLINKPENVIEEMIDGILGAHPSHLRRLDDDSRAIVAIGAPRPGKVGILIGGGSGHEPAFIGYVGRGLADAAAIGNVFASPSPDPILAATKAISGGAGVVYLYGNYAGDVMNFDMAAELAATEDIEVRTVLITDDLASAPSDKKHLRRGVAGDFFVFKIAGAAADRMATLDQVVSIAEKANAFTLTMGVGLSPCSLPQTRKFNFQLGETEMEIGLGIHGEPGIFRADLAPSDKIVDDLMDRLLEELGAGRGDKVAVLVNGLGATPLMELYICFRRVKERLDSFGLAIHKSWVGNYVSSLDAGGMSVTLIKLDDQLRTLLDHPCNCAMFSVA